VVIFQSKIISFHHGCKCQSKALIKSTYSSAVLMSDAFFHLYEVIHNFSAASNKLFTDGVFLYAFQDSQLSLTTFLISFAIAETSPQEETVLLNLSAASVDHI